MSTSIPIRTLLRGRQQVRHLKRQMRIGACETAASDAREIGQNSVVALLERSMRFGHERLAMKRLQQAVDLGAALSEAHWKYCRAVALRSADRSLQECFLALASRHGLPLSTPTH
ncbi:hypothetical protein [Diaphorobacter caeni]|uniref:hypothetical protein n=1 Tax=Diaphorobacter caeni TaxID=2784387 RepID=UPI00188EF7D1|nr:hypothetical protein [Diaphorobacter caeni]MBF5006092.1 hypothetical protein [Diaphorobacter caeni]